MRAIRQTLLLLLLLATSWSSARAQGGVTPGDGVHAAPPGSVLEALAPAAPVVGSIVGQVLNATSARPLSSAQVFIVGTGLGGLTNATGRYVILNVPAGEHALRVEVIGYTGQTQQVAVQDGQATTVDFRLTEEALALDEIVVTGTAGQARRREVGNAIEQIRLDQVDEAVTNVGALLQARIPGAFISFGSGNAGSGADIRLRGNVSASLSNQPLVYIDGIRANSEPTGGRSGATDVYNPLSDLNPADIDRVEVIKGPAATTLYGTEAAAGVIQIFTRRGGQGAPQWTAEMHQGFAYFRPFGTDEVPYMWLDQVFRNYDSGNALLRKYAQGHRQRYGMSVQGGTNAVGYFVSGAWEDYQDPVETGGEKRLGVRANTTFRPHEDLLIQFNNSLTKTDLSQVQTGNSVTSIMMSAIRGPQNYMAGRRDREALLLLLEKKYDNAILRSINGVTMTYTPGTDFTHRLSVGFDYSNEDIVLDGPFGYLNPLNIRSDFSDYIDRGQLRRNYAVSTVTSVDYVGTLGFDLRDNLRNTVSFGMQGVQNHVENAEYLGHSFPGPGDWTLSSAAVRQTMTQNKLRVITGGFFGQSQFGLLDRYFLTLGVRLDGNSAFGENLGLQTYPKVSGSWVASDEAWWPQSLGQMKVRSAYGWAGRAPGAFDKIRTWNPVTFGQTGQAFYPANLGNPDLGPERTKEVEFGFDGSWLDGRLSAELTYYRRTTTDALFRVNRPDSEGGWNAQLENVGELENKGVEINTNATVLNTRDFRWDVGVGLAANGSKVLSLGGAAPFSLGNGGWIVEGQPVPVVYAFRVMNWFELADPILSEGREVYGPNQPTRHWSFQTSLGLPGGMQLSARGELMTGFYQYNYWEGGSMTRNIPHPRCYDAFRKVDASWVPGDLGVNSAPQRPTARPADMYAWEYALCFGSRGFDDHTIPSDYGELRDITLTVPVASLLPVLTRNWANRVDLTLSARNVWTWKNKYLATGHPEMQQNSTTPSGGRYQRDIVRAMREQLPPASHLMIAIRTVF
jgi:outer membrane receptor protein involved in Fe transport